jgi:hypothetical protein
MISILWKTLRIIAVFCKKAVSSLKVHLARYCIIRLCFLAPLSCMPTVIAIPLARYTPILIGIGTSMERVDKEVSKAMPEDRSRVSRAPWRTGPLEARLLS